MNPHTVTFLARAAAFELSTRLGGLAPPDQQSREAELERLWELVPEDEEVFCYCARRAPVTGASAALPGLPACFRQ